MKRKSCENKICRFPEKGNKEEKDYCFYPVKEKYIPRTPILWILS
jgi:hypothetical protein